jgi:hypothetical protein
MKTQVQEQPVQAHKDMANDIPAWEMRLEALKAEAGMLQQRNNQMKTEITSSLALAQQELTKKRTEAAQATENVREASKKLEAEKAEFAGMLEAFKQEKKVFEKGKQKILDLDTNARELREKAVNFIAFIRREAEKL